MSSSRTKSKKRQIVDASSPSLSDQQQQQVKNAFEIFDAKKTGSIRVKQAKYALKSLALQVDKEEIQSWLPQDGTSDIFDLGTFTRMAESMIVQREKASKAFGLFDKDGKGLICLEDLQRVVHELGESMTDEQLQEMLDEVDGSGEGLLNQEDFIRLARNVNL